MGSSTENDATESPSNANFDEDSRDSNNKEEKVNVMENDMPTLENSISEEKVSKVVSKDLESADESLVQEASGSSVKEPQVGMVFYSEDQAFEFYNSYAMRKGFSVRKGHMDRRRDGSVRDRVFLCSNEGISRIDPDSRRAKRLRGIERTNCMARIHFKVDRDSVWVVNRVTIEHNHPLISPDKAHMLRSHRKFLPSRDGLINQMTNAGVKTAQEYDSLDREAHGGENVGLLQKDHKNNFCTKRMRDATKEDVQILLESLKSKQSEDPSFFYAIRVDENEQLANIFWADSRSMVDYSYFGDVVSFDTTFRMNKYDMPFALFLGVNHHNDTIVFGAAILLDEIVEAYFWLFQTFLCAMSERQPKTIFTDQCAAISKAVSMVLPNTSHRLCLWHIFHNATKHLSHLYNSQSNFLKEFENCIYEGGSEEDFHDGWNNLVNKYDLVSNSWLEDLYAVREKWALAYNRNLFCATMTTRQHVESMKNHFKNHFNRKLPLSKFIEQYHRSLIQFRDKELFEDYKSRQTKPVLLVADIPMLSQAMESYTRMIYKEFEDEFMNQFACRCEPTSMDGTKCTFKVTPPKTCCAHVEFNTSNATVTCSCKKFESMGILCMHALKVLNQFNILHLPSQYIMKRWTKYAKDGIMIYRHQPMVDSDGQEPLASLYSHVCQKAIAVVVKSAVSKAALEFFEHGLDKLTVEVENMLQNNVDSEQHNITSQASSSGSFDSQITKRPSCGSDQKDRSNCTLKGDLERRQSKKSEDISNSIDASISNHPSQCKRKTGQIDDASVQVMDNGSSYVPHHREGAISLYSTTSTQPCSISGFTSFPPEKILPPQICAKDCMTP